MARITQQSSIGTTGVSYENEPIIKSDGAGEVMQWQPSDGGTDGVFIIQDASSGSAEFFFLFFLWGGGKKGHTPSRLLVSRPE